MAWVLSAVLLVALLLVAAILRRRIMTLRRELTAAVDLHATRPPLPEESGLEAAGPADPVLSEANATRPDRPALAEEPAVDAVAAADPVPPYDAPASPPEAAEEGATEVEPARPDDRLEPAPDYWTDGRLPSLWALTLLEQQRQWQQSVGAAASGTETAPESLPAVLGVEVERIREEVGTPGSLEVEMTPPATAADDALIFHASRQLLALLVPHTQAFDLVLHRVGDQAVLELTCSGWEGPDDVAEGIGRLLEAVAPAGGDLELDMLPDDRLQATLRLPLH